MKYRADITAGALKVAESRVVAGLLLRGINSESWTKALFKDNVLQARSPETARRLGRMISQRIYLMKPEQRKLVCYGNGSVASHACLAAAVKHSCLLGDFLDLVVRDQYRVFSQNLPNRFWDEYLEDSRARDTDMP